MSSAPTASGTVFVCELSAKTTHSSNAKSSAPPENRKIKPKQTVNMKEFEYEN